MLRGLTKLSFNSGTVATPFSQPDPALIQPFMYSSLYLLTSLICLTETISIASLPYCIIKVMVQKMARSAIAPLSENQAICTFLEMYIVTIHTWQPLEIAFLA